MKIIWAKIILLLITFLFVLYPVFAIGGGETERDKYDIALDKYAQICNKCVSLKNQLNAGKEVSKVSLYELLNELSQLKTTLSDAGGEMTLNQKIRFENIKRNYSLDRLSITPYLESQNRDNLSSTLSQQATINDIVRKQYQRPVYKNKEISKSIFLLGLTSFVPDFSAGAMAGVTFNHIGGYVKFRSSFNPTKSAYDCTSNGSTSYGKIWTNGESQTYRMSVGGGMIYNICNWLSLYGGLGYDCKNVYWQDIDGAWAKVMDNSFNQASIDVGAMLVYRKLVFLVGTNITTFPYADLELGLGVKF